MTFLLYLWMAFAPCLALALYVYWRDKHEKEPVGILVKCFFLGAMITFTAGYSNLFGAEVLGFEMRGENGLAVSFFMAFFVVGFGEEFWKFLVLVFFAFPKSSFNEPFDGIVYSVMIGLGFAALENLDYVLDGGIGVALLRMVTAVPMHAALGVLMGYYVGIAKFAEESSRINTLLLGLFYATFFHGSYDFVLFQNASAILSFVFVPIMIWAFFLCRKCMRLHSENSPFRESC